MTAYAAPGRRRGSAAALAAAGALAGAIGLAAGHYSLVGDRPVVMGFALLAGVAVALGASIFPPSWTLSAGLVLAVFSGQWDQFGLPGGVAPDRLLIAASVVALWDRRGEVAVARRRALRVSPTTVAMVAVVVYAVGSALVAGTLLSGGWRLVDRLGVTGFAVFVLAPMVFRSERDRSVLRWSLVGLGAYLGLTALLETTGPKALVWPHYIVDPGFGIHFGRARGPFAEAEVNGFGLYVCAVAAAIGLGQARRRFERVLCSGVILLCAAGIVFTLSRAVWLGAAAATLAAMISHRRLRTYLPAVAGAVAVLVVLLLVAVPGFATRAAERKANERTLWDRQNLATAAINMVEERPLFGVGWNRFPEIGPNYFWQGDIPLTAGGGGTIIHNAVLANAAELGLIGTTLWLLAYVLGIGGAIVGRAPPAVDPWRIGLIAVAVCWLVMANFTANLNPFQNLALWLWAGVVAAARQPAR